MVSSLWVPSSVDRNAKGPLLHIELKLGRKQSVPIGSRNTKIFNLVPSLHESEKSVEEIYFLAWETVGALWAAGFDYSNISTTRETSRPSR